MASSSCCIVSGMYTLRVLDSTCKFKSLSSTSNTRMRSDRAFLMGRRQAKKEDEVGVGKGVSGELRCEETGVVGDVVELAVEQVSVEVVDNGDGGWTDGYAYGDRHCCEERLL